jgi:hypothetical protein
MPCDQSLLDDPAAWAPATSQAGAWLVIDTGFVAPISGVVTQGRGSLQPEWVTSYMVHVSSDGSLWRQVGSSFNGNEDMTTKVRSHFPAPESTRFVKSHLSPFITTHR